MLKYALNTLGKAIFIYTSWYGFNALFWMMFN